MGFCMGFWSEWVFPRLCHAALSGDHFLRYRRELLAGARGRVVELGSGSGLNLPCYPAAVERVDGVDPNPGMHALARRTADGLEDGPRVELHEAAGEELPFADATFDTAVSTWTLCSVGDPAAVLAEVRRVLKPGGRLLLIEHGLAPDERVARWQRRLTPVQRVVADGCHLDRDVPALLAASGLTQVEREGFYDRRVPKTFGYMHRVVGRRAGEGA